MTTSELAAALGITTRVLTTWAAQGCPHEGGGRPGEPFAWDRAVVEAWRAEQVAVGAKRARKVGGATAEARARRDSPAARRIVARLEAKLAVAVTEEALAAIEAEAFGATARGLLADAVGKFVLDAVGRRRRALAKAPPSAVGPELLATEEDVALLEVVAGIVDGRRRRAVAEYAKAQAAADAVALGDVTEPAAVVARLREMGLDAFGEPVNGGAP